VSSPDSSKTLIDENVDKIIDLTNQVMEIAQKTGNTNLILDGLYKRAMAKHHIGEPVMDDLDEAIRLAKKLEQNRLAAEIEKFRQGVLDDKL